jgi:UDP-glucose 4-epimerase
LNLGNDQPIQIRALAELVRDTLGSRSPLTFVPYTQAFGERFDDLRDRRPDLTRVRQAIGFEPHIPLAKTIRDLADEIALRRGIGTRTSEDAAPEIMSTHLGASGAHES